MRTASLALCVSLVPCLALLPACASSRSAGVRVAGAPDASTIAAFERLKALEGRWTMTDPEGKTHLASEFTVSSNASVVREVMFPGTEHEMTNVYHMDGPTLVMTHYCAAGNQPRMRARPQTTGKDEIAFAGDSVTNLDAPDKTYMGGMTLRMIDAQRIEQHWVSYQNGVLVQTDHQPVFTLTRESRTRVPEARE